MLTRIACISDLHGKLPETTPKCDVLVIAGDICPATDHKVHFQNVWLATTFKDWLNEQPAFKVIAVPGNHDWIYQKQRWMAPDLPLTMLIDEAYEYRGLRFYGTPWQPVFMDWAFNLTEPELAEKFSMIPQHVDVLISHGPPHGYGDVVKGKGEHLGSRSLHGAIVSRNIQAVVCGHIHTGHGIYEMGEDTIVVNASALDERYRPVYKPIMLTFEDTQLLSVRQL